MVANSFERHLDLGAVIAVSIGAMLGSGIFVLPGLAAAKTGASLWLAYLLAGLCMLPTALSKSELATAMPTSGGSYVYLDRAFGPLVGTIAGLGLWLSLLLKSAFALVGVSAYAAVLVNVPPVATALIFLLLTVFINMRGVRGVSRVQRVVVACSLGTLAILVVGAFRAFDITRHADPLLHGGLGLGAATAFVFVAYAGLTKVAAIAEEIRSPERNLPRGILVSLGLVTVCYCGVSFVLVGAIPMEQLATSLRPIHTLATVIAGPVAGMAAGALGVVTMASMANAGLLAASRFPFAMARDDLLFKGMARLHPVHLTPVASILTSAALMAAAIVFFDVEHIAKLASTFMILMFAAVNVAVMVLRESGVQWYKPAYRSPLYPWIQVAGIVSGLTLLAFLGISALVAALAIGSLGVVLYFLYGRHRSRRRGVVGQRGRRLELLRDEVSGVSDAFSVAPQADGLVALFGGERSPEMLVEAAMAICDGGRLHVVHLTEVPEQTTFEAVQGESPRVSSLRRRIRAMADTHRRDIGFETQLSRDIVRTVHRLGARMACRWLFIEWGGRVQGTFTVRNPIGWLKDHVACNLGVFNDAGIRYIRRILVHPRPGSHDTLVATTADRLAEVHGAELVFVHVLPSSATANEKQSADRYLRQLMQLCDAPCSVTLLWGKSVEDALGEASAAYDLLVTMEAPQRTLQSQILGTGSDRLTELAACSVLRVQSPRTRTHATFDSRRTYAARKNLAEFLNPRCVGARLARQRKDALFAHFARSFAQVLGDVEPQEIADALWLREQEQNTAVGGGLALPHASIAAVERTYLGVFTTVERVDYEAPDGEGVDVFFVTLASPSDRQAHLAVLAAIAKMVMGSSLLERLRAAEDEAALLAIMDSHRGKFAWP